jgi:hypothetical protein
MNDVEEFAQLLRDRADLLDRASRSLKAAELTFRQGIHDARFGGLPADRIAAVTGLDAQRIEEIAAAWPAAPPVLADGVAGQLSSRAATDAA